MEQNEQQADVYPASLESLRTGAALIRSHGKQPYKGVTKEMREQWTLDIMDVLSNPKVDLDLIWDDFALFPSDVCVEGVRAAWNQMGSELREAFGKRLRLLNSEKEALQRISLVVKLLDDDPVSALKLFSEVAPRSVETLKRVNSELFSMDFQSLKRLFPSDAPPPLLAKGTTNIIALAESNKVQEKARWIVCKVVLSVLKERELLSDALFSQSVQELNKIVNGLGSTCKLDLTEQFGNVLTIQEPPPFRFEPAPAKPSHESAAEFDQAGRATAEALLSSSVKSADSPEAADATTNVPQEEASSTSHSTSESGRRILIGQWRDELKRQAELLDQLLISEDSTALKSLQVKLNEALEAKHRAESLEREARMAAEEFQKQAADANKRWRELRESLSESHARIQRTESNLTEATREAETLRTQLQARELEHSQEVHELNLRIDANANLRLNEFQERLASDLRDHLSMIPPPKTNVNEELGRILLLRLHEAMEILGSKGINVRPKGSTS